MSLSLSLTLSARPVSDPCLSLEAEPEVDISRLDLRVGRILTARRHPLAQELSVQEVDVGEAAPRTVVSKLGEETDVEEVKFSLLSFLPSVLFNLTPSFCLCLCLSPAPGWSSCVAMQRQSL